MNLKTLGISAAVATSVAVGSVAVTSPAQALTLNFTGSTLLTDAPAIGGTATLNFANVNTTSFTDNIFGGPTSFGPAGVPLTLAGLSLTRTAVDSYSLTGPQAWITGGLPGGRTFTLTTFNLVRGISGNDFVADNFRGFFTPTVGGDGIGDFTTQASFRVQGTSFSTTITAVPTPALLPGLVALGAGVLRKRKAAEAEAVKA